MTLPARGSVGGDERSAFYRRVSRGRARRPRGFHAPSVELVFALVQAYDLVSAPLARRAERHGLSLAAFNVLTILSRCAHGCLRPNELSRLLLVSRANVTGLLDTLVRKGFVVRRPDPSDGRACLAVLTARGRSWLDSYLPGHHRVLNRLVAGLGEAERGRLTALLGRLRRSAQGAGQEAA
ncbi:MAG: MarR family transcriptional regulator [Elusimicrobiota bacterium]